MEKNTRRLREWGERYQMRGVIKLVWKHLSQTWHKHHMGTSEAPAVLVPSLTAFWNLKPWHYSCNLLINPLTYSNSPKNLEVKSINALCLWTVNAWRRTSGKVSTELLNVSLDTFSVNCQAPFLWDGFTSNFNDIHLVFLLNFNASLKGALLPTVMLSTVAAQCLYLLALGYSYIHYIVESYAGAWQHKKHGQAQ